MRFITKIRLRQKFLAIILLASSISFVFCAFFIVRCLAMIEEIQTRSLEDDLYEVDAIIRNRLSSLDKVGAYVQASMNPGSSSLLDFEKEIQFEKWFETVSRIDFIVQIEKGVVHPIAIRGATEEQSRLKLHLQEWYAMHSGRMGYSGFMKVNGAIYLAQSVQLKNTPDPGMLFIGVAVETSLFPGIEQVLNDKLVLVEDDARQEATKLSATIQPQSTAEGISLEKQFPGLVSGSSYRLRLTQEGGLFDSLQTRLVWFPALFLTAIILSALFGAAWATHIVLRPLGVLNRTMLRITGPESYGIRARVVSHDEIGELAGVFNHLMERLEEAQLQLKAAQHREIEIGKLQTLKATVVTLAHQINNPLAALLGKCELLLLDQSESSPQKHSLEVIRDMALRITEVIRKLQSLQAVETTIYLRDQDMVSIEEDEKHALFALEEQRKP